MTPYSYDLTFNKNTDFRLSFQALEDDNTTPLFFVGTNAIDTYECRMIVTRALNGGETVLEISNYPSTNQNINDTIQFSVTEDGRIDIDISEVTINALTNNKYHYTIILSSSSGYNQMLLRGRIDVFGG
jgi:hypothetical protein